MQTNRSLLAAWSALQAGDPARAAALAQECLRPSPEDPVALAVLGAALQGSARHAEAAEIFEQLTRLQPAEAAHWVNLGTAWRAAGEPDRALMAYATAASLGARGADFQYNVGLLHQERGDYTHAVQLLGEAHAAAPRDPDIALQFAQCCYELMSTEEASRALASWEQFTGLTPEHIAQVALLLLNLGDARGSSVAVQRLLRKPAPGPLALLRLSQILERNNRLPEAQNGLAALLADPRSAALGDELRLLDAQLAQRAGEHERAAAILAELAARESPHRKHIALFPLAKSQQALRQYATAWTTLEQAHDAQLQRLLLTHPTIAAHDEPPLLIARHGCRLDDVARWRAEPGPADSECPVFIVAFPRSGTTLLEQALDSHPGLASMDEQPFLQQVVERAIDMGVDYPAGLGDLTADQLEELRAYYWSLVRAKVELAPGQRLLDKNPLNMLRLPMIRRLFPRARVILAIRHPLDVLLSCYSQHFRAPEFALLCQDIGTLARGYRRCFEFWYAQAQTLQPLVLEVRYEDLVADFERGMHAIATFLELPWDEAMLHPAERARNKGYISTPSYAQVIEPVSTRAIGKWQPYREQMQPALSEIAACMARWDYTA